MSGNNLIEAVRKKKGTQQTVTSCVTRNAIVNIDSEDGRTSIHSAIAKEDFKIVEMLLNHNADINAQDRSGNTPLHCAVKKDSPQIIELLISRNANVNVQSEDGTTPLHLAVVNADVNIVERLLNHNADINAQEHSGNTPLHSSAKGGCPQIVELLISRNANVNVKSKDGTTPLHLAIDNDHGEIVKMLLNQHADINAPGVYGHTPLHRAVMKNSFKMVELLVSRNANVNAASEEGPPLFKAIEFVQLQVTEYLLNHGADVNFVHTGILEKITPLYYASHTGSEELIKLLLSKGADVNTPIDAGYTPLYHSIDNGRPTIVKLLLQHGADVNTVCSNQWTALTIAVTRKDITMIEDILKYRPDVNLPGNRKAFKYAIQIPSDENGREIVKKFLKYGFTCNYKESNNPKIVRTIVENGYLEIAEDIFKYIDDINSVDFGKVKNVSLLHIAIHNKNLEMTKALIKHGADVNIRNGRGKPIIFDAVEMGDAKSLDLLLGNGIDLKDYPDLLAHAVKTANMEIVQSLVQHPLGLDINAKNKFGMTVLHDAARRPINESCDIILSLSPEFDSAMGKIAKILLHNGVNVNDQCNKGRTPLHFAALKESIAVLEVLLEYDSDVSIRDGEGMTPLHCCAGNKKTTICEMLIKKGADASARRTDGKTLLHLASQRNRINVIKMLLNYVPKISSEVIQDEESSPSISDQCYREIDETTLNSFVDIDSRDNDGRTALDIAANDGQHAIVEVLLGYGADVSLKILEDLSLLDCDGLDYERTISDRGNVQALRNCDPRINVDTFLHAHMKKTKALGLNSSVQDKYLSSWEGDDYDYKDEVEKMKNEKIGGHAVSMYDFLTKNANVLASYARNKSIVQALKSGIYNKKFGAYSNMINGNLVKGQKRNILLNPSVKSFNALFSCHLPDVMTCQILAYLSNADLVNMIKACMETRVKEVERYVTYVVHETSETFSSPRRQRRCGLTDPFQVVPSWSLECRSTNSG